MFYRVTAVLLTESLEGWEGVQAKVLRLLNKCTYIEYTSGIVERSYVQVERCAHEDDPPGSCEVLRHLEGPGPG